MQFYFELDEVLESSICLLLGDLLRSFEAAESNRLPTSRKSLAFCNLGRLRYPVLYPAECADVRGRSRRATTTARSVCSSDADVMNTVSLADAFVGMVNRCESQRI